MLKTISKLALVAAIGVVTFGAPVLSAKTLTTGSVAPARSGSTYTPDEIVAQGHQFFGKTITWTEFCPAPAAFGS